MAALAAPLIIQRLRSHFAGTLPAFSQDAINFAGGVRYRASGAVHFREWFSSAGTGRLGDGTSAKAQGAARYSSGIWLNDLRWLSIGSGAWVEYEAATEVLRNLLKFPEALRGIYENSRGELFVTDAGVEIPEFLVIPNSVVEKKEERTFRLGEKNIKLRCIDTRGFMRREKQEKVKKAKLQICQNSDENSRNFVLSVSEEQFSSPISIWLQVYKNCSSTGPCSVSVIARVLSAAKKSNFPVDLRRYGLRRFENADYSLVLERWGGAQAVGALWQTPLVVEWTGFDGSSTLVDSASLS
jgi:hypothetical protein